MQNGLKVLLNIMTMWFVSRMLLTHMEYFNHKLTNEGTPTDLDVFFFCPRGSQSGSCKYDTQCRECQAIKYSMLYSKQSSFVFGAVLLLQGTSHHIHNGSFWRPRRQPWSKTIFVSGKKLGKRQLFQCKAGNVNIIFTFQQSCWCKCFDTSRSRQVVHHCAEILKLIFLEWNCVHFY